MDKVASVSTRSFDQQRGMGAIFLAENLMALHRGDIGLFPRKKHNYKTRKLIDDLYALGFLEAVANLTKQLRRVA